MPDICEQILDEVHEDWERGGSIAGGPTSASEARRSRPAPRYCTDCGGPTSSERCEGCERDYQAHMLRARRWEESGRAQRERSLE